MALVFPRADLLDLCTLKRCDFWPVLRQEISREQGGASTVKELGSPLWRVEVVTAPLDRVSARRLEAFLLSLSGSLNSFLLFDVGREFPAKHLAGLPSGMAPVIDGLSGDMSEVSIGGLVPGFELTEGDHIGFQYGGNYAVHAVLSPASVGSGEVSTGFFNIEPPIRAGAALGDVVTLSASCAEFSLTADNAPPQASNFVNKTASFAAMQRLT